MASQLRNDLIRTDRSNAVDASSPLSDNMAAQLQDDETELNEQIEKLASYTSADRPTMERLFHAIVRRYESCWSKADERQRPYCMLLTRLRVFDPQHFDMMMRAWVQRIRKLTERPPIIQFLPLLISFGCLSLAIVFATAARTQAQASQLQPSAASFASVYMQELLKMLMVPLTPTQVMSSEDCYRFRIVQERARLEHAKEVMLLIRGALAEYSAYRNQQTSIPQPLEEPETVDQLLELLRDLVLVDSNAACQTLSLKSPDPKLAALIESLTTQLLIPNGDGGQKSFEQVLELANEFTLPFCQVKLSLNLAIDDSSGPEGVERLQSRLELLSKAMDNAIDANNVMWTGMLSRLTPEITQHLKSRAELRFLELLPSLKSQQPITEAGLDADFHMAENLLTVVDSTIRGTATATSRPSSPPFSSNLVDKLVDVWEILASTGGEHAALRADVLTRWLPLLLSYLALLATTCAASAAAAEVLNKTPSSLSSTTVGASCGGGGGGGGGEVRGRALLVLAGLVQELDDGHFCPISSLSLSPDTPAAAPAAPAGPGLPPDQTQAQAQNRRVLREHAFDIALVLADGLPEDARQQCVRAVRDSAASGDPRLRYLFSFNGRSSGGGGNGGTDQLSSTAAGGGAAAEGLMLAQRERLPPPPPPSGAGAHAPVAPGPQGGGGGAAQQERSRAAALAATNMAMMGMGMGVGMGGCAMAPERLTPFQFRRWEILSEPTPNVGENDTSLSLTLFDARKL